MKTLAATPLTKLIVPIILVLFSVVSFAAEPPEKTGIIKGKVSTADDKPAAYVTVELSGTRRVTVTDENGLFVFRNVRPGAYNLTISLVGFETITQKVKVDEGYTVQLHIQLSASQKQLKEVIVRDGRNKFVRRSSNDIAKMPLDNLENSQVYSTITKDLIEQQSVFTIDDAIRNAPGLSKMWNAVGRAGFGYGGSYFSSRGFSLQSQLRNGVVGNMSTVMDVANIESIEVVKGPAATLFGNILTTYGGMINRVTKKPYESFGGELSYAGGSYGYNRLAADLNTPLSKDNSLLLRTNIAYTSENSFQDAGFSRNLLIAPSIAYKASDRLSFLFDVEAAFSKGVNPPIIYVIGSSSQLGVTSADQVNMDYKRSFSNNSLVLKSGNLNFFGQMNYKLSSQWNSQTNISLNSSNSDGYMPYFNLIPDTAATPVVGRNYLTRCVWTSDSRDNATEIQQNFIGDFKIGNLRNRLIVGLDYFNYKMDLFFGQFIPPSDFLNLIDIVPLTGYIAGYLNFNKAKADSAFQTFPSDSYTTITTTNNYSAYVSNVLNITPQLLFLAALRVDHFRNKGQYDPLSGTYSGGYNQTALSPKLGLVYQLFRDKLSLFGNYQNGFVNKPGVDSAGKTFRPEQADQWEVGVKMNVLDGKLSATFSYYDIDVSNVIRNVFPGKSVQDGARRSKGFEIDIIANPVAGLNIVAGCGINDCRNTKVDGIGVQSVNNRRPTVAGSPAAANVWISYNIPTGKVKGLGLGIGGNYASESKIVNSVSRGAFGLPAYTIFNASVFYDQPKFRVAIKSDNLTNKEYWIGYTSFNPQPLRSIVGSVAFKF